MAYSLDFRRKVLSVRKKEGLTIAEVAARFDVGVASVRAGLRTSIVNLKGFVNARLILRYCGRIFEIILMLISTSGQNVWV
ncbi:hypothetical protein [Nitrosomonas sp. Nm34]|uniref:hypothetical protein n=1 Tax=Nitrosomonas sp. Nm34 TaxID=1881055 RepID=UPI0011137A51|nr:hypothetical protein [Nitrosomonas sp. Nm34]